MPRLFRLLLLVMCISAITLVAGRWIGEMRPSASLTAVMSDPDGTACNQPCLFGVQPGKTSLKEAVQMLHAHPLTRDAQWRDDTILQLPGPAAYVVFSLTRDGLVDSMTFTDNLDDTGIPVPGSLADSITLGELIVAFGSPTVRMPSSDYFVINFAAAAITAASVRPHDFTARIQAGMPVNMVMLYAVRPCPMGAEIFEVHPWLGFTAIARYASDSRPPSVWYRPSGVPVPPFAPCQQ